MIGSAKTIPPLHSISTAWRCCCFTWIIQLSLLSSLHAGGGPENVFLVVNPLQHDSLTIANHYAGLRQIPASNVYYLEWSGDPFDTDIETFRAQILGKVLSEIEARKLSRQIDYVAYSSGYPYAVNFSSDLGGAPKFAKGSLTGLTYLHELSRVKGGAFTSGTANNYMRLPNVPTPGVRSVGFRGRYRWGNGGQRLRNGGRSYLLSVMLGFTAGKGNTADEVIDYLHRSAYADGSDPAGKIYYMRNQDIRSKTRHGSFPEAVAELEQMGITAEIGEGILPLSTNDVQGAMIGFANFDWPASQSQILPGAICENFTSFGGVLKGSGQTPLSEFLRHGAAGSSGTVVEPYAVAAKFPHPMIQVHYARGCSLAEAYYQSVRSPYQLLIVGDPLCRPWARIPQVSVDGLKSGDNVAGAVKVAPQADWPSGQQTGRFEFYLDGRWLTDCAPGGTLEFDSTRLPDGYHELRAVAIDSTPIENQGRIIIPFTVKNRERIMEWLASPPQTVRLDQRLTISARSPGSARISLFHNRRRVATIEGEEGKMTFDVAALGYGPVAIRTVGISEGSRLDYVFGKPIKVNVLSQWQP